MLGWHHLTGSYKDQWYKSWKYVPTIISNRDSDLIGVRIPQTQDAWEARGATQFDETDIVRFSGNVLWKRVPKQEFILKSKGRVTRCWWAQRQFIEIYKKVDFHNYVNKEITFVRSNDIMMYARGKHTQFNNDRRGHPEIWTRYHDQCWMMIQ